MTQYTVFRNCGYSSKNASVDGARLCTAFRLDLRGKYTENLYKFKIYVSVPNI